MKKYFCSYPFMGSLTCEVEAENENDAIEQAENISAVNPAEDMDWELDSSTIIARE